MSVQTVFLPSLPAVFRQVHRLHHSYLPKLTEARKKANKKWDEDNKDRKNYIVKRSTTKNFILKSATEEDLKNIESYIIERKAKLKESK